jgi:transposase
MHDFLLTLHNKPASPTAAEEINKHYQTLLAQADEEEPKPVRKPKQRGKLKQSIGRNLLNRLQKHQQAVLAFSLDANVPFTNNQAERDLRNIKVKQKVSGGFRTLEGAMIHARLQAIISTFRKQGMKVYPLLRELFLSQSIPLAWVGR